MMLQIACTTDMSRMVSATGYWFGLVIASPGDDKGPGTVEAGKDNKMWAVIPGLRKPIAACLELPGPLDAGAALQGSC